MRPILFGMGFRPANQCKRTSNINMRRPVFPTVSTSDSLNIGNYLCIDAGSWPSLPIHSKASLQEKRPVAISGEQAKV